MSIIVNRHIIFIDSLQFYNSSLDTLASNLKDEDKRWIWDTFNFNTFEDFDNHYLKKDILLSTDSFKKFISACLKYYNLDPCHYFSAPGLSWDAMLKMTGVTLEKT